jgi:conjugal transfer pilus assembly protein TraK
MSSILTSLPACLVGGGMASISWGVTRLPDTGFKTLGLALLITALSVSASPALADQFVEAYCFGWRRILKRFKNRFGLSL